MITIAGYEDSHSIPGHEKLGHDHTWLESWTNNKAMGELVIEGKKYRKLNSTFEGIFSECLIPDHEFHTLDATTKLFNHFSNSTSYEDAQRLAAEVLRANKRSGWALIFSDRILIWNVDNTVKAIPREKPSSP